MKSTEQNDEENFQKYVSRMDSLKKDNLTPPPPNLPLDQLIIALCAEGMVLLEAEAKKKLAPPMSPKKDDSKKLNAALAANDPNPYVRARALVLSKMSPKDVKRIEMMESLQETDNGIYSNFIKEVSKVGDKLSDKNNK